MTQQSVQLMIDSRAGNTRPRVLGSNRAARRCARQGRRRRSGCSRVLATTTDGYNSRPGVLFLNNRYHDPTLGTFISVDPAVERTGQPYIYAGGNPITLSDPNGLDCGMYWGCDSARNYDGGGRYVGAGELNAFDEFVARLWAIWVQSGRDFGGFVDDAAREVSDVEYGDHPLAQALPFEDPSITHLDDPDFDPVLGESGWRADLVDGDQNPARHFTGFLTASFVHGPGPAMYGLEGNEGGRQGSSLEDLNSGYAAVAVAGRFAFDFPVDDRQFAVFIRYITAVASDRSNSGIPCCQPMFDTRHTPVSQRGGDGEFILRQQQARLPAWQPSLYGPR